MLLDPLNWFHDPQPAHWETLHHSPHPPHAAAAVAPSLLSSPAPCLLLPTWHPWGRAQAIFPAVTQACVFAEALLTSPTVTLPARLEGRSARLPLLGLRARWARSCPTGCPTALLFPRIWTSGWHTVGAKSVLAELHENSNVLAWRGQQKPAFQSSYIHFQVPIQAWSVCINLLHYLWVRC